MASLLELQRLLSSVDIKAATKGVSKEDLHDEETKRPTGEGADTVRTPMPVPFELPKSKEGEVVLLVAKLLLAAAEDDRGGKEIRDDD